jgi:hypothetical protein
VGRALIAAILLHTLPEVMQILADLSDALTLKMGYDPNLFSHMRAKMGEKSILFFWVHSSLRETATVLTTYLSVLFFHFSFYMADALFLNAWTLLYIISPVLIALYVLPVTAAATSGLYRSLIEICCWKPLWWLIATLLWSTALSDISKTPESDFSFLSIVCYNLVLGFSLLMVPFIVHSLGKAGLSMMAPTAGAMATGFLMRLTKTVTQNIVRTIHDNRANMYNTTRSGAEFATRPWPKAHRAIQKLPKAFVPKNESPPFFIDGESKKGKKQPTKKEKS